MFKAESTATQERYSPLLDDETVMIPIRNRRAKVALELKQDPVDATIATIAPVITKSFSRDITNKYLKKTSIYLATIGGGVLVTYFIAPVINVPMEYIIVPLSTSIAGTLLANKVNKLISVLSYFTPKIFLDENSTILQQAETRIAALRSIDNANKSDCFSDVILQLQNNILICQGILEGGSQHFANLFIHDIKTLMSVPSQTLAGRYRTLSLNETERMRTEFLDKTRDLLKPYDLASRKKLANFITEIMHNLLPQDKHENKHRVKPIFLDGPPGIGKTRLIKELSTIFSIPLLIVDMGTVSLEDMEGMQMPSSTGLPSCRPGLIMKTLTDKLKNPSDCNNLIVLLDEVDKAFTKGNSGASESTAKVIGYLHPFLQTDKLRLQDKGYNISIDISNMIVVCTANRNCFADEYIEETTRTSLQDRVSMIKMPKLEKDAKEMILQKLVDKKLTLDQNMFLWQKGCIKFLMYAQINHILDADKKPGLRDAEAAVNASYIDSYNDTLEKNYGIHSITEIIREYVGTDLPEWDRGQA